MFLVFDSRKLCLMLLNFSLYQSKYEKHAHSQWCPYTHLRRVLDYTSYASLSKLLNLNKSSETINDLFGIRAAT